MLGREDWVFVRVGEHPHISSERKNCAEGSLEEMGRCVIFERQLNKVFNIKKKATYLKFHIQHILI